MCMDTWTMVNSLHVQVDYCLWVQISHRVILMIAFQVHVYMYNVYYYIIMLVSLVHVCCVQEVSSYTTVRL